jgi:hypothetical protein
VKEIELTQGYKALVDDADFDWLNEYKWCADVRSHTVYAVRSGSVLMHRMIMNHPVGMTVDHKDRNGLNDQRSNLRLATLTQQQGNKVGHGVAGVKGVTFHHGRWRATICTDGVQKHLGRFDTIEEAEAAYAQAARAYFGEFALTGEGAKK